MTRLLFIQASPRGTESSSLQIAQVYLETLLAETPDVEVDTLDLWDADLPTFDGDKAAAKLNVILGKDHDATQKSAWDQIVGIANRFISADRYVFAVPMWNGGIPYRLKQYIDLIHQPGLLFGLNPESGYIGMLKNKRATLVLTSGAFAPNLPSPAFGVDHHSTYLRSWLNQAGISAIDELRFQPTLLTSDPLGDLERATQAAADLARMHGRVETGASPASLMKSSDVLATATATAITAQVKQAAPVASTSATTTYHRVQVDGIGLLYREAGPKDAPTIVLLHGFPSSSRQFDTLIPLLAPHYHLIAPDFPGFGQSDAPPPSSYTYSFDNLAITINRFLEILKLDSYTLYLHDYGAPVCFRIMTMNPERLHALIIQNGNIYEDGLGSKWAKIAEYWADPKAHPEVVDTFLSFEATRQRHTAGTSHPDRYNPDTWTDEYAHLAKPGQRLVQETLLYDYRTNVASYPKWQAWLRDHKPPALVAWGANDPSFTAPGAVAFKRDLPDAEIHLLDAGHFALEEQNDEIARLILDFMARHPGPDSQC